LSSALIIGGLIGYIFDKKYYKPTYTSSLTLAPNFESTYQLYGNIDFYQTLIDQKDFKKLKSYLNIDSSDSKFLKEISIKPYKNELLNLKSFKELLKIADSTTGLSLSYDLFSDKIPFESYSFHVINLKTTKSEIPSQLEESIIKSVENNIYFKNKKETFIENLKIKKEYVLKSIQKVDTLLFGEKKNINSENLGTTIVLDKNQNENIDIQLFDRYTKLRNELVEINFHFNDKKNVINTINSFSDTGTEEDSSFIVLTPLFFFLMLLFLILISDFNRKLSNGYSLKIKKLAPNKE
jgi:hypothetical protein